MKRILLIITALLLSALTVSAQGDLQVGAVFDGKVVAQKAMKETFIRSSQLDPYHLEQYHSVSFTGDDQVLAEVSRRVLADAEKATDQEIHMNGGNLVYAILTFAGADGDNRFVCYQSVSKAGSYAITLVYMHGPATLDDLKKLFKTKTK
jgi:hypothetical protein